VCEFGKTAICLWIWLITKQLCWIQGFLKFGSKASGLVETGVWAAGKQPVALLAKS
jgi:hypothetical protein